MPILAQLRASQPHAVSLFQQALQSGRLHQGYILVEAHADAALAEAVTQTLMCVSHVDWDACDTCTGCRQARGGNHPDVLRLGPNEKGVINVSSVRDMCARLQLRALAAPTKVVVIERADTMNEAAQNALLKTLEEPPGASCFLLCVARPRRLLPTLRSRCQTVHLERPNMSQALATLGAAGMDEATATLLAPLVGNDAIRAQAYQETNPNAVMASLTAALAPDASPVALLTAAADLGTDQTRYELALGLLERRLVEVMAARYGAPQPATPLHILPAPHDAGGVVKTLQRLRQQAVLHINRAMALEGLLLQWTGKVTASGVGY